MRAEADLGPPGVEAVGIGDRARAQPLLAFDVLRAVELRLLSVGEASVGSQGATSLTR